MGETLGHLQTFSFSSFVTAIHELMQMVQNRDKEKD